MDQLLILGQTDTDAVIAFLLEGRGAPAMLLIISWNSTEEAMEDVETIKRCGLWAMQTQDNILTVQGHGPFPLATGEMANVVYWGQWDMEDDYVVSLFLSHCKHQGFFLLQPAVNKIPALCEPLFCSLMS